jgi:hypothetical protein
MPQGFSLKGGVNDDDQRKIDISEGLRHVPQRPLQKYRDYQGYCDLQLIH